MNFNIEEIFYKEDEEQDALLFFHKYKEQIISSEHHIIFILEKLTYEEFILEVLPILKINRDKFVFIYFLYILKDTTLAGLFELPYIEKFLLNYSHILFNKRSIQKNIKEITNNQFFMLNQNNIIDIFNQVELFKNLNKKKVPLKIQKKCFHYILKNYKNALIHVINLHFINDDRKLLDIPFIHYFFFKNLHLIKDLPMKELIILENQINNF